MVKVLSLKLKIFQNLKKTYYNSESIENSIEQHTKNKI